MVYLIDTDVMVDISCQNADAAGYLDSLNDPAISIITAQELIVGARDKRDLAGIDSLVLTYPVTALEHGCTLVSRNRKHFAMIAGLPLEIPPYHPDCLNRRGILALSEPRPLGSGPSAKRTLSTDRRA